MGPVGTFLGTYLGTKWGPSWIAIEHPITTKAPLCRAFLMPEEGLEPPTRGL
jgi:hypothetical protein